LDNSGEEGKLSSPLTSSLTCQKPGSTVTEELSLQIRFDFSAIGMDVRPLRMRYEFHIDDELFFNQIKQIV
jgi:hypothetical protein